MALDVVKRALSAERQRLKKIQQRNLAILRQRPLQELSGAFGDIGTFLPVFYALSGSGNNLGSSRISVSSTLVFSGLANIFTGVFFGVPLPVQPMKAIAATVLLKNGSHEYDKVEVASAGLFVAGVIFVLSVSGLLHWFMKVIPTPLVKGIQMGTGLSLVMASLNMLTDFDWHHSSTFIDALGQIGSGLGMIVLLAFLFFLATRSHNSFAVTIVAVIAIWMLVDQTLKVVFDHQAWPQHLSLWDPRVLIPTPAQFLFGATNAGLGQVPLTALNSIVAVTFLVRDLLPDVEAPSATSIGLSVSAMNLVGCWFSAMPTCHGSGGLAAQYRFGARSGSSVIFLGSLKLLIGLFASEYALSYFEVFPMTLMGVFLFLAGVEMVKLGESVNGEGAQDLRDVAVPAVDEGSDRVLKSLDPRQKMRRWLVMTVTVGVMLGLKNDGLGFLAGFALHWSFKFHDWYEGIMATREGRIRLPGNEG
jgi:hypothetical protein